MIVLLLQSRMTWEQFLSCASPRCSVQVSCSAHSPTANQPGLNLDIDTRAPHPSPDVRLLRMLIQEPSDDLESPRSIMMEVDMMTGVRVQIRNESALLLVLKTCIGDLDVKQRKTHG